MTGDRGITLSAGRAATAASHHRAVEHALAVMRERFAEPLTLRVLAEVAHLSPYHFSRVFRQVTGLPPHEFLTALRLDAAKRLLLTSELRAADVCFAVGYNSVGTFTSHFTQLVGLSPSRLRRLSAERGAVPRSLLPQGAAPPLRAALGSTVSGHVAASALPVGPIFIGLFSTPLPRGLPAACALLAAPGPFVITSVPDGRYHVLAIAFPSAESPPDSLLPDTHLLVGRAPRPLLVQEGDAGGAVEVSLHLLQHTDPPLVSMLPSILVEHLTHTQAATGDVARPKSASSKKHPCSL